MSYSRFSNSAWYTYWCVHPNGNGKCPHMRDERFEVCTVRQFTFAELEDHNAEWFKGVVREIYGRATEEELDELVGYAREFMADVRAEYDLAQGREEKTL